jgi:hypothetical protein
MPSDDLLPRITAESDALLGRDLSALSRPELIAHLTKVRALSRALQGPDLDQVEAAFDDYCRMSVLLSDS